jgi:hypothetical protein
MNQKKKMMRIPNFVWKLVAGVGMITRPFEEAKFRKLRTLSTEEVVKRSEPFRGHTLYHFHLSPFSARVRQAIAELQIEIPCFDVLENDVAHAELMAGGRRDLLPCLKIETPGQSPRWMYESADIVDYLKSRAAKP